MKLVILVDIGKERADNHSEAIAGDGPGSMLTTAAGTEILTCHKDATRIGGIVKDKILVKTTVSVVAPVAKKVIAKETLLACCCLQKTGRDNLVCIHIL